MGRSCVSQARDLRWRRCAAAMNTRILVAALCICSAWARFDADVQRVASTRPRSAEVESGTTRHPQAEWRRLSVFSQGSSFDEIQCNSSCNASSPTRYVCSDADKRNCDLTEIPFRSTLSDTHIAIMTSTFFVTLLFYVVLVGMSFRRQQAFLDALPRRRLPLGRDMLSPKMHKVIVDETARVASDACSMKPARADVAHPADLMWVTLPEEEDQGERSINPRTEITKSFVIIEKVAQRWDPSLQRGRNQSVRDFMVRLRERCRVISSTQSNAYTDFYEKARFSEEVITLDEYNRFTDVSLHLVSVLLDSARARDA